MLLLLALILSSIAVLLQIITLVIVAGKRKSISVPNVSTDVRAPQSARQGSSNNQQSARGASGDRFEKRDHDSRRHERRPYPEQREPRPRPQAPAAPAAPAPAAPVVDPVEKSLRDINMKLKNAERDQESARRSLQENLGNDRLPRGGGERDSHRGGRDGGDRGRRGGRDRNSRRDNWQDRNRQAGPQQMLAESVSPNEPVFENKETVLPVTAVETTAPVQQRVTEPPPVVSGDPNLTPSDFNADDLQHGRKVMVKRRMLKDEGGEGAPEQNNGAEAPAQNSETASSPETSETGSVPVEFGRR
jgi:hypothetical protein